MAFYALNMDMCGDRNSDIALPINNNFDLLLMGSAQNSDEEMNMKLKIMQSNIWQETTQVPNGFDSLVKFLNKEQPDIILLSEVRNYNKIDFQKKLKDALTNDYYYISTFAMRGPDSGDWDEYGADDTGIMSKYPFIHGGKYQKSTYGVIELSDDVRIAVFSLHLDYSKLAQYLPRGHSPDCCEYKKLLSGPVTDETSILEVEKQSRRFSQMKEVISFIEKNYSDLPTIIGGDFNTPSFLDWREETKNNFDRNGAIISWPLTKFLSEKGFLDTYRSIYPDPKKNPGFTWLANTPKYQHPDIKDEKIDERERIDFIFSYSKNDKIKINSSYIIGPSGEFISGESVNRETDSSKLVYNDSLWFSDHLTLISEIELR